MHTINLKLYILKLYTDLLITLCVSFYDYYNMMYKLVLLYCCIKLLTDLTVVILVDIID